MDLPEIIDYVRQNTVLSERISELTAMQASIKKQLKEGIAYLGVENDRGHIVIEIDDEVSGVKSIMQQKKISKSLDIEVAEEILKDKGIHERCIQLVPVLNEDEIMAAYYEGIITEDDIDTMFPSKVVWALVTNKA
jgi:exoribonuclease R